MRSNGSSRVRIGTSGYQYDHWKGVFYPQDISRRDWFAYYTRHFDTVEINNTFYRLPEADTFEAWREQAPPDFRYALKFSRYGTHLKYLKDPQDSIGKFVERAERLKAFLGPILVQLPPRWTLNINRLKAFLDNAPREYRWAVEFRHPSWLSEEVFALLREHDAALCIHDMLADHPRQITADWTYLRFHGERYGGLYSHQFLSAQARWIGERLAEDLDVYAYFNNDAHGYAVQNAGDLKRYLETS